MAPDRRLDCRVSHAASGGALRHLRAALARVAGLFSGHRADDDLRDELLAHLEMETAEYIRRGMTPEEARRLAQMSSGGLTQAAESVRAQRGLPWLESVAADVGYAVRALRRSAGFTAAVVVTLGLGIGANTAIFSVIRGVLLKPLPHRNGDRLVYLRQSSEGPGGANVNFSVPEINDLREYATSLGGIAEYSPWPLTLQSDSDAVRIDVNLITGNYFEVMGLSPVLGRLTRSSDDGAKAPPVMVLTHEFWLRHFGGDSSVVGRTLQVDDTPVTVIGVVETAPYYPSRVDALLNMVISPHHLGALMLENRVHRMTEVVARLAPGVSVEQARADVAAVHARMRREHRSEYQREQVHRIAVIPFREVLGEGARRILWLLMGAAAFVMVIAAANVTNLALMRGVRKEHELVVRAALGAGVGRLRRLLLVENLVLAIGGASLGLVVALGGVALLTPFAARYSPRAYEISLDTAVLGFTLALSVALALVISFVAPMPEEGTFTSRLSGGGQRMSGNVRQQRLQRGLVVTQVAVSVVLLTGAGLLTRTAMQLANVQTGLESEEVLTIPVALMNPVRVNVTNDAANHALYLRMQREIATLPGVVTVGLGSTMPLRSSPLAFDIRIEGAPIVRGGAMPHADFRTASPEYFRAAGIPVLAGRDFASTDRAGSERVVIINKALADLCFAGQEPLGKRIAWTSDVLQFTPISGAWRTVVGVVGNTQDGGLDVGPSAVLFAPFAQEWAIFGGLVIRTDSNVSKLKSDAAAIVRRLAPAAPIGDVWTVAQIKNQSVAPRRLNAALAASFGILAALMAAMGIAGVLAFSVSARTGEIGIRMSLGADGGRIQRMILLEGGVLLAVGLLIGIVVAFFAARAMRGLLFGVAPSDLVTFGVVAFVMMGIGAIACWVPARRASRIDPAIAMRL